MSKEESDEDFLEGLLQRARKQGYDEGYAKGEAAGHAAGKAEGVQEGRQASREAIRQQAAHFLEAPFSDVLTTSDVARPAWRDRPISELNLPIRAFNGLMRAGLDTIGAVYDTPDTELLEIPKFGEASLDAVKKALKARRIKRSS